MIELSNIRLVFEVSLKLSPRESCLIVTDAIKEGIARQFYDFSLGITDRSSIAVMEPAKEDGTEPPQEIAEMMLSCDVQLLITDKSISHTRARRSASQRGSRIASMPGITEEIANRCLNVDYEQLRKDCGRIKEILAPARSMRITTERGTDLAVGLGPGKERRIVFFGEHGGIFDLKGDFGNLPEGEISFAPNQANGIFIVDASFPGLGLVRSALSFMVKDGSVWSIAGEEAGVVRKRLDAIGPKAYKVAEIGIGMNPKAIITGTVLEDEKVLGTVHVALGNDLSFGGDNDVPIHVDGVIRSPDITVDSRIIMKKGVPLWEAVSV